MKEVIHEGGDKTASVAPAGRIPLSRPSISELDISAVAGVLRAGWLSQGANVSAFEEEFSQFIGSRYAVAVTNGSLALELAFSLAKIEAGDEIIMPSINYVAAANAARRLGAVPVFCDVIGSHDLSLDPASVARCVSPRTRIVCVLHYAGFAAPMEAIRAIADGCGPMIVEDCAHALGAEHEGKRCGALAELGTFSFFSNKNMTTGEGGMVTVNREAWRDQLLLRRTNGMSTDSWARDRSGDPLYDVVALGTNARLDEIRAALGRTQLQRLPEFIERRRELVIHYRARLEGIRGLVVPFRNGQVAESAHHLMVVILPPGSDRKDVIYSMKQAGVQTSVHYTPIHQLTTHRQPGILLPKTDAIANSLLTLPLFPEMTFHEVDRVGEALQMALENQGLAKADAM